MNLQPGDIVVVYDDIDKKPRRVEAIVGELVHVSWDPRWPCTQRLNGLFTHEVLVLVQESSLAASQ